MAEFLYGFFTCFVLCGSVLGTLAYVNLRAARRARRAMDAMGDENPLDAEAREQVRACKSRLRWRREINPDWIKPLPAEIVELTKNVARVYYPDAKDDEAALLAPGLSHFARATELAARDVAEFLESPYLGWMFNVSGTTALRTYRFGRQIADKPATRFLGKWASRITPVLQALRYKSPLTWASLLANNLAFRIVQPAVIDIVARRVIELYSGRILDEAPPEVAEEALAEAEREIEQATAEAQSG